MYCVNCGKSLEESSKYCKNCGSAQLTSLKDNGIVEDSASVNVKIEYAGFIIRLGAYLADYFILSLLLFVIVVFLRLLGLNSWVEETGVLLLIYFACWLLYSSFFLENFSRTPGKALYGLIILDELGKPLASKAAIIRSVCQPLSTSFFGIGYWRMKQNGKNLTWHDKMAHTVVIVKQKKNYLFPILISGLGLIIYLTGFYPSK